MSKYIDMEVKADVKIDKIAQPTLKLKESGVTIIPGLSDIGSAGLRYTSTGKWEYNNGDAWVALLPEGATLPTTEVIHITASDLVAGVATITHNLGKVPFGLDYSVTPKAITYVDENTMTLDFSDQPTTFTGASVWFIGSQQSMLVVAARNYYGDEGGTFVWTATGTTNKTWVYTKQADTSFVGGCFYYNNDNNFFSIISIEQNSASSTGYYIHQLTEDGETGFRAEIEYLSDVGKFSVDNLVWNYVVFNETKFGPLDVNYVVGS